MSDSNSVQRLENHLLAAKAITDSFSGGTESLRRYERNIRAAQAITDRFTLTNDLATALARSGVAVSRNIDNVGIASAGSDLGQATKLDQAWDDDLARARRLSSTDL